MDDTRPADDTPLDAIAYLARSANRVTALTHLAEGPTTRRELYDATGISQPTLTRLLEGFEARGWVRCDRTNGRTYERTPFGDLLATAFDDLLTTVQTMQDLEAVAGHLPLAEMAVDLRRFADATVTVPSRTDAMAHMRREDELIDDADRVRFLCSSAFAPGIKAYRDRIVGSDQSFEAVITADALDAAVSDPETAEWVRDLAGAANATIYRYDGPVSLMLGIIDDVASIVPLDESGVPLAFIETGDPAIRGWVEDQLDSYREQSTRVTADSSSAAVFTV